MLADKTIADQISEEQGIEHFDNTIYDYSWVRLIPPDENLQVFGEEIMSVAQEAELFPQTVIPEHQPNINRLFQILGDRKFTQGGGGVIEMPGWGADEDPDFKNHTNRERINQAIENGEDSYRPWGEKDNVPITPADIERYNRERGPKPALPPDTGDLDLFRAIYEKRPGEKFPDPNAESQEVTGDGDAKVIKTPYGQSYGLGKDGLGNWIYEDFI